MGKSSKSDILVSLALLWSCFGLNFTKYPQNMGLWKILIKVKMKNDVKNVWLIFFWALDRNLHFFDTFDATLTVFFYPLTQVNMSRNTMADFLKFKFYVFLMNSTFTSICATLTPSIPFLPPVLPYIHKELCPET